MSCARSHANDRKFRVRRRTDPFRNRLSGGGATRIIAVVSTPTMITTKVRMVRRRLVGAALVSSTT